LQIKGKGSDWFPFQRSLLQEAGTVPQLKTQGFASDTEVAELVQAFEEATIPAANFTHVAHIAVALSYLAEFPRDQALARMRDKTRNFAARHHADGLYHETLTTFWMLLLDHLGTVYKVDLPLWQRINIIVPRWGHRWLVEAHYSHALITSKAARESWVPPDRLPLAF
jgi:hypothetical protein